jgi:hypothetical protein
VRAAAPFIIFATAAAATETELKAAIICALRCKVMVAPPPSLNKSVSTPPLLWKFIYQFASNSRSDRKFSSRCYRRPRGGAPSIS